MGERGEEERMGGVTDRNPVDPRAASGTVDQ